MKKILYLVCLLLIPFISKSQDISIDKKSGDITKGGKKIGQLEKGKGMVKSYTLFDEDGKEVATFEPQTDQGDVYYVVFFTPSGNKATCNNTISMYKDIAKAYGKSNIVKDGEYQESQEARMISALQGGRYFGNKVTDDSRANTSPSASNNEPEDLLDRNRNTAVLVYGTNIKQDNKTIGEYKMNKEAINGGLKTRIKFYNHEGKLIAEAFAQGAAPTSFTVVTLKDNEEYYVDANYNHTVIQEIAEMLVSRFYL